MKYFNSVTGQIEDDGKDLPEMQTINLPAGRLASPDGSQDINFPVYADMLKRERLNSQQLDLGMKQNPDQYPFAKLGDINFLANGNQPEAQVANIPSKNEITNPIVKKYLQDKIAASNKAPSQEESPDASAQGMAVPQPNAFMDKFGEDKYKEALGQMKDRQSNVAFAQLAAGIGDALARKDSSSTDNYFKDLRGNIQDQTVGEFNRQKAQFIADAKRDPNSQDSQNFRKVVESTMPGIAKAYGDKWNLVTASDSNNILDFGKIKESIEARKQEAAMRSQDRKEMMDLRRAELSNKIDPQNKYKQLTGTDKARLDNAMMTLKALDEMGQALDGGQNTFSMVGDNDYTNASRRATEAYGRMQSGGAINKDEEKRFEKTLPQSTDSKEMQRKKIIQQREEMLSRLKTLGFSAEDVGYKPVDFKYGKSKKNPSKPQTVVQNGHTYTLNPETGEYE